MSKNLEKIKGPKPVILVSAFWDVTGTYEEKGNWFVEGYCTLFEVDSVGDMVTKEAAQEAAPALIGKTLLHNHNPDEEIGTIVAAKVDDKGLFVKALISKAEEKIWTKVKERVLDKFSIRMLEYESESRWVNGRQVNAILKLDIPEISLTSLPCVSGAIVAHSYVSKTNQEENIMKDSVLSAMGEAIKALADDFRAGKIKSEAPPPETQKTDEYGYGKLCPFQGTDECPLNGKDPGNPDDELVAKECKYSSIYECPYAKAVATPPPAPPAEEAPKVAPPATPPAPPAPPAEVKTITEELFNQKMNDLRSEISELVKQLGAALTSQFTEVETALNESLGAVKTDVASVKSSVQDKMKTLESMFPASHQPPIPGSGEPESQADSFWKGVTPW